MEDSFKTRVEKVFGSLQQLSTSNAVQSSPWILTDIPVERRDWKKGRDEDELSTSIRDDFPCSSSFEKPRKKHDSRCRMVRNSDLSCDDAELDHDVSNRECRVGEEDWEIRASIGMDQTLDNEEEEDEYDRVAEGIEEAEQCLYMRDAINVGLHPNFSVPLGQNLKDPRANHSAANIRLQEDWAEGQQLNLESDDKNELRQLYFPPSVEDVQLRPILKRKTVDSDSKTNKKVKFNSSCKASCVDSSTETAQDVVMATSDSEFSSNGVPDYLCNPARYTRYSFNSSDEMDERSNSQAYMDFLTLVKASKDGGSKTGNEMEDSPGVSSRPVTFIPRKKPEHGEDNVGQSKTGVHGVHCGQSPAPCGVTTQEVVEHDDNAMEDDDQEALVSDKGSRKSCRRYRTKSCHDESE